MQFIPEMTRELGLDSFGLLLAVFRTAFQPARQPVSSFQIIKWPGIWLRDYKCRPNWIGLEGFWGANPSWKDESEFWYTTRLSELVKGLEEELKWKFETFLVSGKREFTSSIAMSGNRSGISAAPINNSHLRKGGGGGRDIPPLMVSC